MAQTLHERLRGWLPAPEPIAAGADGRGAGRHPAILMTRLPGRLDVTLASPEAWLPPRSCGTIAGASDKCESQPESEG